MIKSCFLFLVVFVPSLLTDGTTFMGKIQKAYTEPKTLSFDGQIKFYSDVNSTSPAEIMSIVYQREGINLHIEIGNQIIIYDGKTNIVVEPDKQTIYLSTKKVVADKKFSPVGQIEEIVKQGQFEFKEEDYLGNQKKMTINSPSRSKSVMEFLYDPKTYYINFARMVIDGNEMLTDERLNHKKLEYSYYNYKSKLEHKISVAPYIKKEGKKFVGTGNYSKYKIVVL